MNEITCKVCGDKFTPFKSRKYEVVIPTTSFGIYSGQPMIGEAFDCPMCGCQHIVNTRYKAATEAKEAEDRFKRLIAAAYEEEEKVDLNNPFGCITCKYGNDMTVLRCRECEPPFWKNYEPQAESEENKNGDD